MGEQEWFDFVVRLIQQGIVTEGVMEEMINLEPSLSPEEDFSL